MLTLLSLESYSPNQIQSLDSRELREPIRSKKLLELRSSPKKLTLRCNIIRDTNKQNNIDVRVARRAGWLYPYSSSVNVIYVPVLRTPSRTPNGDILKRIRTEKITRTPTSKPKLRNSTHRTPSQHHGMNTSIDISLIIQHMTWSRWHVSLNVCQGARQKSPVWLPRIRHVKIHHFLKSSKTMKKNDVMPQIDRYWEISSTLFRGANKKFPPEKIKSHQSCGPGQLPLWFLRFLSPSRKRYCPCRHDA